MARTRPDNSNRKPLLEEALTGQIIAAFYETYNILGYGFLESVYRRALTIELRLRGLQVEEEVRIDVFYKGSHVGYFRLDHLVEGRVGVEIKAGETLGPTDKKQTLNYLTSSTVDVGLLLHYGPTAQFFRLVSPRVLE